MFQNKFNFKNNRLCIFSVKSLKNYNKSIISELKNYDIIRLHSFLLNKIEEGWYAEAFINDKQYLLNDFKGSYRVYVNIISKNWSSDFWKLSNLKFNSKHIDEVLEKGYTTGFKTISDNIQKLLPASIFDIELSCQRPNVIGIFQNNSPDSEMFDYEYLKNKKIGIAFSGGLDSTFLASQLIKLGLKPDLYFFITEIDDEKELSYAQANNIAKKLNLKLIAIKILSSEIINSFPDCFKEYPNDISYSILAIKLFINKIEKDVDVLMTGQNSDTFIAFGLSRAFHPIESLSRFLYKNQYKKIYNGVNLSVLDKIILKLTYKLRNQDIKSIPKNRKELILGWSNEKFYLSRYFIDYQEDSQLEYYDNLNYMQAVILNKLINHISGNHSLVWSDAKNIKILMPLGNKKFMHSCFKNDISWKDVFNPKRSLKNDLIIDFNVKKHPFFQRLISFFNYSEKMPILDFDFKKSYNNILYKQNSNKS